MKLQTRPPGESIVEQCEVRWRVRVRVRVVATHGVTSSQLRRRVVGRPSFTGPSLYRLRTHDVCAGARSGMKLREWPCTKYEVPLTASSFGASARMGRALWTPGVSCLHPPPAPGRACRARSQPRSAPARGPERVGGRGQVRQRSADRASHCHPGQRAVTTAGATAANAPSCSFQLSDNAAWPGNRGRCMGTEGTPGIETDEPTMRPRASFARNGCHMRDPLRTDCGVRTELAPSSPST